MPAKFIARLTAIVAAHPAHVYDQTRVKTTLTNSQGRLTVVDTPDDDGPCSTHTFTLQDAGEVGVGPPHNQEHRDATMLLALACSLTNDVVLFASTTIGEEVGGLQREPSPSVSSTDARTGVTRVSQGFPAFLAAADRTPYDVTLDGGRIMDAARRVLAAQVARGAVGASLPQVNAAGAIRRYEGVLRTNDPLAAFEGLFSALEHAVNAAAEKNGKQFDQEAAKLNVCPANDIFEVRQFNNRVKHAQKTQQDLADFVRGEAKLPMLASRLKRLADTAILKTV